MKQHRKEVTRMIKKVMTLFFSVVAVVLLSSAALPAALIPVINTDIVLDGRILDVKAAVNGQNVYLPVRAVCEALGYDVLWSDKDGTKTVTVTKYGDTVMLELTHQRIIDNGHEFEAGVYSGAGIQIVSRYTYMDSGLFSTVFTADSTYNTKSNQVWLQRRCENNIKITTEKLASSKAHLKATIQYPQISGLPDAGVQNDINTILKKSAQNALNEGQKNADDMAQAIKDGYTGAVGMCETNFDYMTAYNQNGLFSVVLMDYQYTGGAHGGTVQSSFTFDLATGIALKLSDLMDSATDFTGFINTAIRNEINRWVAEGGISEFEFSKFKDIGVDPAFYLTNDAVVFYFQEYSYFPYAAGIQEFTVTYTDLSDLMKDKFGLS